MKIINFSYFLFIFVCSYIKYNKYKVIENKRKLNLGCEENKVLRCSTPCGVHFRCSLTSKVLYTMSHKHHMVERMDCQSCLRGCLDEKRWGGGLGVDRLANE